MLEVDDVVAERDRVVAAAGWSIAEDLIQQPRGAADFRLHDPDGYYLRITHRQGVTG